jgi:uncharacterized protein
MKQIGLEPPADDAREHLITSESDLRALYGAPKKLAAAAKLDRIDELCRRFIALSPFICVGSCDAAGRQDVSPRGDRPGFVRVLDGRTLVIPDRPGNNKIETLSNLLVNPRIGILFVIPGHDETLRINGRARISRAPALLAAATVEGKVPKCVILVTAEEVYPHCGKAFRRARLWDPASSPERNEVPSLAAIARTMAGVSDVTVEEIDARVRKSYETDLY